MTLLMWVKDNTSWRDLSLIRLKCSISMFFSTVTLFPALHTTLFLTASSNTCLLLDPLSELGDAGVDTGLVATSTALTPTHNAGLEPLPTLLKTHQGATGVSLVNMVKEEWLLDWVWKWKHDYYMVWKPIYKPFVLLFFYWEHVACSHLACINSSCQKSTAEHPGGDLALHNRVTHCVVDDFQRGFLQNLCLLT